MENIIIYIYIYVCMYVSKCIIDVFISVCGCAQIHNIIYE